MSFLTVFVTTTQKCDFPISDLLWNICQEPAHLVLMCASHDASEWVSHLYSWICFSHPRQWQTITTCKESSSNLSAIKRKHTHTCERCIGRDSTLLQTGFSGLLASLHRSSCYIHSNCLKDQLSCCDSDTQKERMICLTTDVCLHCSMRRTRNVFNTFALKSVIICWKISFGIIYSPLTSIQSFFCERRKQNVWASVHRSTKVESDL